jgi:hypothetical protein
VLRKAAEAFHESTRSYDFNPFASASAPWASTCSCACSPEPGNWALDNPPNGERRLGPQCHRARRANTGNPHEDSNGWADDCARRGGMTNRTLTAEELGHANLILADIHSQVDARAGNDPALRFAYIRKIAKELTHADPGRFPSIKTKTKQNETSTHRDYCRVDRDGDVRSTNSV